MLPYSPKYVDVGAIISFNVDDKNNAITTLGYIPPYYQKPDDPVYDIKYSPG